ncbi:hypothetical protein [Amycolatopsis nigrescens]|uniref:hypothetical protein n=1 Tax=Amycolatopsis nigrescens TaxID=381445 RepID=UPI00036AF25B|nr:hypothetical protein [Amycolatopsis nigrescens]
MGSTQGSTAWAGLVDDAALFPPGDAPMAEAVPAHRAHREAWYAELVGPFVVAAAKLGELTRTLDDRPLDVSITAPGGPAQLSAAWGELPGTPIRPVAVEVAVPADLPITDLLRTLDERLPDEVLGFVEVPRGEESEAVLDALAGTRYLAKFRTGGTVARAFPGEPELAAAILGCVDRELPFKCTAGLHHAVRHTAPDTGFEHHGFLNVLLATAAALDGDRGLARILAERSGERLAAAVAALGGPRIAEVRRSFRSLGSCSVTEPLDDLAALGLLDEPDTEGKD